MVALALVSAPRRHLPSRVADVANITFRSPAISPWRKDPIATTFTWRANDKLYCYRFHPHRDRLGSSCIGRFMLTGEQVEVLLEFWSGAPLQVIDLPQIGKTRCQARHLPDGGLQLVRSDQFGKISTSFRLFARDVLHFLSFAERWLPRI